MKKIPQRSCVFCRKKKDKNKLYRIVKTKDGNIFFDPSGKSNGRGAYVCDSQECLELLNDKKNINRMFKTEVSEEQYLGFKETIEEIIKKD
jgi:predicted RNA-binding protein YlxR (DUF448 family)